jgi:hypothetical protein
MHFSLPDVHCTILLNVRAWKTSKQISTLRLWRTSPRGHTHSDRDTVPNKCFAVAVRCFVYFSAQILAFDGQLPHANCSGTLLEVCDCRYPDDRMTDCPSEDLISHCLGYIFFNMRQNHWQGQHYRFCGCHIRIKFTIIIYFPLNHLSVQMHDLDYLQLQGVWQLSDRFISHPVNHLY